MNFGRNRISKKHAYEIAQLLLSSDRRIVSLCLDSTCLGRGGFITIMSAASKSQYLTYLDVADTNFTPITQLSPKSRKSKQIRKNRIFKNRQDSKMNQYYRKEAINSILNLLSSKSSKIQHLIIGHNDLNYDECKLISKYAANRGLITLDLVGNNIDNETLCNIHDEIFEKRMEISSKRLIDKKEIPLCISSLIIEYSIHQSQCLYRCFKWKPR